MKSLKRLLEIADKTNIAEDIISQENGETRLNQIGTLCRKGYEDDLGTCNEHFEKLEGYIKIAKQVVEEKSYPWPKAANAKYPLLTVAAMQFNARAYPALIPSNKIVKARHFGEDQDNKKSERADRIAGHMSYQLIYDVEDWQENMDALLLQIPITGMMFKKTYRDTIKQKTASTLLMANQLVMNNDTTRTVESCPRVTEVLQRHPYQIQSNIDSGLWTDAELVFEDEDNEEPEDILEQHVLLDIYDDGNKEPYIVTIHEKSGKVLRIKAGFDEDTIFISHNGEYKSYGEVRRSIENENATTSVKNRQSAEAALSIGERGIEVTLLPSLKTKDIKPICVEKIQYYTEYGYLPAFDGKYYKCGLGDLVASLSGLIDTNLNQMLDAGTLANLQGGLRQKVGKTKAGKISLKPGEFSEIDTGGVPIRESIHTFDFPGPSGVLFSLLGMLIEAARDITSIKDIMVGEAPQGETATTTMIKREEGMRVFSAIYKRLYRAMSKEFKKLYTINRKYLKQKEYFIFGDSQSYVQKVDYEDDSLDILPVANPNESTTQERLLKAQALMSFLADPDADPIEIKKNYMSALGIDETEYGRFFPGAEPTAPAPDQLKTMAEIKEIEAKTLNLKYDDALKSAKTIEALANAGSKEVGPQLELYKHQRDELMKREEIGDEIQRGGDQGVESQPTDSGDGLPTLPEMGGEGGAGVLEQDAGM